VTGTDVDVNKVEDPSLALTHMKTMTLENSGMHVVIGEVTVHEPELARQRLLQYSYVCARTEPQACKIAYEVFHSHVDLII
jgi:hypothetical protein